MVQILPSLHEQLGESIDKLSESIQNIIDPNHAAKQALAQRLIIDPQFRQQFADFVHKNPEMGKDIGKRAQKILSGVNQSLGSQIQTQKDATQLAVMNAHPDIARDQAIKEMTGQTQDERDLSAIQLDEAKQINQFQKENPELAREGIFKKVVGQDRFAYQMNQLSQQNMEAAHGFIMQNPNASMPALVGAYFEGKLKPEIFNGLLSSPQYGEEAKAALKDYFDKRENAWAFNRALLQTRAGKEMAREDRFMRMAVDRQTLTGGGTVQGHYQLMFGDGNAKVQELLKKNPNELTGPDRELLDSYNAQTAYNQTTSNKQNDLILKSVNNIIQNRGGKNKPPMNTNDVIQLNELFRRQGALTGGQVQIMATVVKGHEARNYVAPWKKDEPAVQDKVVYYDIRTGKQLTQDQIPTALQGKTGDIDLNKQNNPPAPNSLLQTIENDVISKGLRGDKLKNKLMAIPDPRDRDYLMNKFKDRF